MTESKQIKYNSEKANNAKYSKTKLRWTSVASYDTQPGNEGAYSTTLPSPHGV